MDNAAVAEALETWADFLALQGAGHHKVAAYRRAAQTVSHWQEPVEQMADPTRIPGVGSGIGGRIQALLGEGWPELDEARRRHGVGAADVLRGDLHCHTRATDGRASVRDMALAAQERGHEYLAITDHSKATRVAGGLGEDAMRVHLDAVRRASDDVDVTLLAGAEVDILRDGRLDYGDDLLADMDVVVCSVHFRHALDGEAQTQRILRAMANEHADILAHPTARRGARPPMDIDIGRLAQAAADQGWAMEINGSPDRLDLRAEDAAVAAQRGALLALDSDAHATHELGHTRLALQQARAAGVPQAQMLNALPLHALQRRLS